LDRIRRVYSGQKAREIETEFFYILKNWHDALVNDIDEENLDKLLLSLDKMIRIAEVFLGLEENKT